MCDHFRVTLAIFTGIFFLYGVSIWFKQWVGLKAEWNSFLSALSTMTAALGTMEVSCHLNAICSSLYVDVSSSNVASVC